MVYLSDFTYRHSGALPAPPFAVFAWMAAFGGAELILEQPAAGLFLFAWGLGGLYGTASLWMSAFNWMNSAVVIGLLVGCMAVAPVTYGA